MLSKLVQFVAFRHPIGISRVSDPGRQSSRSEGHEQTADHASRDAEKRAEKAETEKPKSATCQNGVVH